MATTASMRGLRRARALAAYAVLGLLAVWTLGPLYWMVTTSLKTNREVYGTEATLWPREPTLANYRVLFTKTPFAVYFQNSTLIALATTADSWRGSSSTRTSCRSRSSSFRSSRSS